MCLPGSNLFPGFMNMDLTSELRFVMSSSAASKFGWCCDFGCTLELSLGRRLCRTFSWALGPFLLSSRKRWDFGWSLILSHGMKTHWDFSWAHGLFF